MTKRKSYIIVWTTTPWTIIGNFAIAVHPEEQYAYVRVNDEYWILSKSSLERGLLKELGIENYEVMESFPGKKLEGLRYEHPLAKEVPLHDRLRSDERVHRVITSSEYVKVEEGTGCLHVAPSFGPEDFDLGLREKLPLVQFINEAARFNTEGGIFEGLSVDEAGKEVIKVLTDKNLIVRISSIMHEYPHCWRCKTPLVFRLTKQWFFKVSDLREELAKRAQETRWIPAWAKSLFIEWLKGLDDWCISRQRFWGTPMPIWVCEQCKYYEVIGSLKELSDKSGIVIKDFHRPKIDEVILSCPKCGNVMKRVPDVVDVWVDSGSAIWAVLPQISGENYSKWETLDFILEGKDQIRGWFSALFVLSIVLFNKLPFKTVYMHGFVTDEKGMAMHKSLGNIILPEEVVQKRGAEILRFYQVSSTSPGEDQRFGYSLLKKAQSYIMITLNTFRYLKQLTEYCKGFSSEGLDSEDKWLISRINSLIKEVTNYLESYQLPYYARALHDFIVEDVSHFYIQLARERIRNEEEARKVAYTLLYVLEKFLRLMAPLNPMLAEKLYLEVIKPLMGNEAESVHLLPWPIPEEDKIDIKLEEDMAKVKEILTAVKRLKQKANIKMRWPCMALYIPSSYIAKYEKLLLRAANVKNVIFEGPPARPEVLVTKTTIGSIGLDTSESIELKAERLMRDLSRHIRATRKKLGLKPVDKVIIELHGDKDLLKLIKLVERELLSRAGALSVIIKKLKEIHGTIEFEGKKIEYTIRKV